VLWHCWFGVSKSIQPVKMSDDVLAWLSVWRKVQMICIWSSWCHFIGKEANKRVSVNQVFWHLGVTVAIFPIKSCRTSCQVQSAFLSIIKQTSFYMYYAVLVFATYELTVHFLETVKSTWSTLCSLTVQANRALVSGQQSTDLVYVLSVSTKFCKIAFNTPLVQCGLHWPIQNIHQGEI